MKLKNILKKIIKNMINSFCINVMILTTQTNQNKANMIKTNPQNYLLILTNLTIDNKQ